MAYKTYMPGNDEQALQNWYALALQQQVDNPDVFQQLGQANPGRNFAVSSSGSVLDFGQSTPAWQGVPSNTQLDYANPIEVAGVGKGWLAKNDPSMTVYNNSGQPIASLGNDRAAGMKIDSEKAQLTHAQLQNQRLVKEINARPKGIEPKLVDGQWVYPPSPERPGGIAYPVEGYQRRAGDKQVDKEGAQSRVTELLGNLQSNYEQLHGRGATVDTKQNWFQNLKARVGASAVGQAMGGAIGSPEQEIRDKIQMAKPLLINEIRAATGMSAKAMDSNAELQFYLQAATDPTRNVEANLQAIRYLDKAYGGGRLGTQMELPPQEPSATPTLVPQTPASPAPQGIRDNGAYIEADGKRYIVIRRNPDGSAVIRDPQTGRTGTMRQ